MVSRLAEHPTQPTFVVTRHQDWEKHFAPAARWKKIGESGDFLLLELLSAPGNELSSRSLSRAASRPR